MTVTMIKLLSKLMEKSRSSKKKCYELTQHTLMPLHTNTTG